VHYSRIVKVKNNLLLLDCGTYFFGNNSNNLFGRGFGRYIPFSKAAKHPSLHINGSNNRTPRLSVYPKP